MEAILDKMRDWLDDMSDWDWGSIITILVCAALMVGFLLLCLWAGGAFYDEVENYDFTAQVFDKDHYTTTYTSYVTTGKTRIPVVNTVQHYKIMWEDGNERGELEVGSDHYNKIKIGDYINLHCSVREDKQGELHYYYSFKGY